MHSCIYKNGIYSPKHNNKMPCCLDVVGWENKMNPSAILITVIYSNGNRKMAAILSFYLLFSPYSVCTSYLYSFLSNIYVFCIYFLFVELLLLIFNKSSQCIVWITMLKTKIFFYKRMLLLYCTHHCWVQIYTNMFLYGVVIIHYCHWKVIIISIYNYKT